MNKLAILVLALLATAAARARAQDQVCPYPGQGWTCEVGCDSRPGDESVTCIAELTIAYAQGTCPGSYCETGCAFNTTVKPDSPSQVVCPCATIYRASGETVRQSCHIEWTHNES